MTSFISLSKSSQKAIKIFNSSIGLPLNILIVGEVGVGKKIFIKTFANSITVFQANDLEYMIKSGNIDLSLYDTIGLFDIDKIINKKEFFANLKNIKLIASSSQIFRDIKNIFAVKIVILPLKDRQEDLDTLAKQYTQEAKQIFGIKSVKTPSVFDLSSNAISLRQSIFKDILLQSFNQDDIHNAISVYLDKQIQKEDKSYRDLLEIFEKPLFETISKNYNSQVQMANKLDISRITLRKKLEFYGY